MSGRGGVFRRAWRPRPRPARFGFHLSEGAAWRVYNRLGFDNDTTSSSSTFVPGFTPEVDALIWIVVAAEEDLQPGTAGSTINDPTATGYTITPRVKVTQNHTDFEKTYGVWTTTSPSSSPALCSINQDGTSDGGASTWWFATRAIEIHGHDLTTPFAQGPSGNSTFPGGASASLSVTLTSTPASGNMVVASLASSSGGTHAAPATPTVGGQAMTQQSTNAVNDYEQITIWYRICDGTETSGVVSCSDVGGSNIFGAHLVAAEINASGAAATVPDAPTAVTAKAGDDLVAVRWTAPGNDGGSPITGYKVERNVNSGGWVTAIADTGKTREWYFDTHGAGLGASIEYRVSAINAIGTGAASTASTGVTTVERLFPTTVDAGGRYFDDQNGNPWYGFGDTAWSGVAQLTEADMRQYFDDRQSRGFTLVLCSIPEPHYTSQTPKTNNVEGQDPFTGAEFDSSLNEPYWELVDYWVRYAEVCGITILACPIYLGFSDSDGWGAQFDTASNAGVTQYGADLNTRYSSANNLMWLTGHDRVPTAAQRTKYKLCTDGLTGFLLPGSLHDEGTNAGLQMEEWTANAYVAADFASDGVYEIDFDKQWVEDGWASGKMVGFFEGIYEQERATPDILDQRRQSWLMYCAGAAWVIFGNNPIWHFDSSRTLYSYSGTWQSNLSSSGSVQFGYFISRVNALPTWHTLVPDTTDTLVTAGEGTGADRLAARFDGDTALLYMPTSRAVTLDLTEFSAGWSDVTITRIDPTDNTTSVLGTFNTTGSQVIADQGTNAGADSDWVLLIEGNTPAATQVDPVEATSSSSSDTANVVPTTEVDPVEATSSSSADVADVVPTTVVDPVEATSSSSADVADVVPTTVVDPVEATSSSSADVAGITATADVDPVEATSSSSADVADVVPTTVVDPVEATSSSSADVADVVPTTQVDPVEATSSSSADVADVVPTTVVDPAEATSSTSADVADIDVSATVNPVEATSSSSADVADVVPTTVVDPAEATSSSSADVADVVGADGGDPGEATSASSADVEDVVPTTDVDPVEATSSSSADVADITSTVTVDPVEATSASSADVADVVPTTDVDPAEATSSSSADVADITATTQVDPVEATSASSADVADISGATQVDPVEATSSTTADVADVVPTTEVDPAEATSSTSAGVAGITATTDVDPVGATSTTFADTVDIVVTTQVDPVEATSSTTADVANVIPGDISFTFTGPLELLRLDALRAIARNDNDRELARNDNDRTLEAP